MKIIHLVLAAVLSVMSTQAAAQRQAVPIVNHEDVLVETTSGRKLSAEEVRQAITSAPAPRGWQFSEPAPGRLIATLNVRGKHTIVTEITYSATKYSIRYKDSVNMKYSPGGPNGQGQIHPFYNTWVDELRSAIRTQLIKA